MPIWRASACVCIIEPICHGAKLHENFSPGFLSCVRACVCVGVFACFILLFSLLYTCQLSAAHGNLYANSERTFVVAHKLPIGYHITTPITKYVSVTCSHILYTYVCNRNEYSAEWIERSYARTPSYKSFTFFGRRISFDAVFVTKLSDFTWIEIIQ